MQQNWGERLTIDIKGGFGSDQEKDVGLGLVDGGREGEGTSASERFAPRQRKITI